MSKTHKSVLHGDLNLGGSCTLSRLDDVGAGVRLRLRLTDLADEDMDSAEGDPIPLLNLVGLGALASIVDVELAVATLSHPTHGVFFDPREFAIQELKTTVLLPHGGRQLSWFCHGRCPSERN